MQANRNCRNSHCRSGLPIDQELICLTCWNTLSQDQRFEAIRQTYRTNIANLSNRQDLSEEERRDLIGYQRYLLEIGYLDVVDPGPAAAAAARPATSRRRASEDTHKSAGQE